MNHLSLTNIDDDLVGKICRIEAWEGKKVSHIAFSLNGIENDIIAQLNILIESATALKQYIREQKCN